MKKFVSVLTALFICSLMSSAYAEDTIYIDMRLLIAAHPLFAVFDSKTNRFKGTSSEFIEGGWDGVQAEIEKIKKKQDELLKSPETLKEKLKTVPLADRLKLEREYLKNKQKAEDELQTMKTRVHMARQFPEAMGKTIDNSIMAQINIIVYDIRNVVRDLKKKYSAQNVIDITDLLPYEKYDLSRSSLLVSNMHAIAYKSPQNIDQNKFIEWLEDASVFWSRVYGIDAPVIPYGALDVRLESIKLLEERAKGLNK